jgi:hypothetical protein
VSRVGLFDLPGIVPDPSLGEPRIEGPTTHLHGESRPDGLAEAVRRSRVVRDILVLCKPRASSRADSETGGDRDHLGEPLLLGVDVEHQISYRDSAPET